MIQNFLFDYFYTPKIKISAVLKIDKKNFENLVIFSAINPRNFMS